MMKKSNFLILFLPLICIYTFAGPFEPVRTMVIPSTWHPMVIDGYATETAYSEEQTTLIFNPCGYTNSDADFKADFRLCWDHEFLYLYTEIIDDTNRSYQGEGNPWEYDNITVFLQLDTNTVAASWNETTTAIRINRDMDSIQEPGHAAVSDFLYTQRSVDSIGWTVETGIPWTSVLPVGAAPDDLYDYLEEETVIGFELIVTDSDIGYVGGVCGYDETQSEWDIDDFEDIHGQIIIWFDTRFFGYAQLSNEGLSVPAQRGTSGNLKLYPNPVSNTLKICNTKSPGRVQVYDIQGKLVLSVEYSPGDELDLSVLNKGLYTLKLDNMQVGRFIKQ